MTDIIEEARALLANATPGPWKPCPGKMFVFGPRGAMIASTSHEDEKYGAQRGTVMIRGAGTGLPMDANHDLIVAAPDIIARLAAALETARADLAAIAETAGAATNRLAIISAVVELKELMSASQGAMITFRGELDSLRKDNYHLIWNLAGCDSIAGAQEPTDFAEDMAMPALRSVNMLAQDVMSLRADNVRLHADLARVTAERDAAIGRAKVVDKLLKQRDLSISRANKYADAVENVSAKCKREKMATREAIARAEKAEAERDARLEISSYEADFLGERLREYLDLLDSDNELKSLQDRLGEHAKRRDADAKQLVAGRV